MSDAIIAWARAQFAEPVTVEPLRVRPWSSTWRVAGEDPEADRFILKEAGGASPFEAALVCELAQAAPDLVPAVRAADTEHGWFLMADVGTTFRAQSSEPAWDQEVWERMAASFGRLQRIAEPLVPALLKAGVPDEEPQQLPLIVRRARWEWPELAGFTDSELTRVESMASSGSPLREMIATVPIPASVQHGDLHDNNVSPRPAGEPVFLDWGDASIAHPFTTMLIPMSMATEQHASPIQLDRLRDAYLGAWTDLAPLSELREVLAAVLDLAWINRAASWQRALQAAPEDHDWGTPLQDIFQNLLETNVRQH